jgi:hypothetical protein
MTSCFDALALDLQAAVLGDRHASPLEWLIDVEDDRLQSAPRSQEYLEAPDTALLRSCFPRTLSVFPEEDAVKLMMLGLRDDDIIGCVQHGLTKISCVTSQANPVDAVFRMAAHMSELSFDDARHRLQHQQQQEQHQQQQELQRRLNEEQLSQASLSAAKGLRTPPLHAAAARPEHTLSRALVQRSDPKWQPDDSRDNCGVCRKEFTWSLRRHHCR